MFKTQKAVYKRILSAPNKAFTTSDFLDLADYKTISKSLELLEDQQFLKRARRGVYYLPRYNSILKIETGPDINEVAKSIARQYHWKIIPTGAYALNILGLSTQVPNKIIYISSGPYVQYSVGRSTIVFKHSTTKQLVNASDNLLIAIQAMKELGKDHISDEDMIKIKLFLNEADVKNIKTKLHTTAWINDKLRSLYV